MKKTALFVSCIFVIFCTISCSQKKQSPIQKIDWLIGEWVMNEKGQKIVEVWHRKNDSLLIGQGYIIDSLKRLVTEEMRIEEHKNELFFIAQPKNQNMGREISFKLKFVQNDSVVFENLNHDFPKRIIYHYIAPDSISAMVEDDTKNIHFGYKKISRD